MAGIDLTTAEPGLKAWLDAGFHGAMDYMARHGLRRARPAELVPGTVSVITARMDYLPRLAAQGSFQGDDGESAVTGLQASLEQPLAADDWRGPELARLGDPGQAVISVYARGRDYHKVLRARLQRLAERIAQAVGPFGHRAFTDSAPVLEVELASRSGIGWRGKHTLALHRDAGSMFFLGELFVDLALPATAAVAAHCGSCTACLDVCPTGAIVAPYRLDARRCISYLTIELDGPIPLELRPAIGNRILGCDDCQLACPWNKFAQRSTLPDFDAREGFADASLLTLWRWDETQWLHRTEGSAIRRIGYARWRRNLSVAMGNALRQAAERSEGRFNGPSDLQAPTEAMTEALVHARSQAPDMVAEHIDWALSQAASATVMTETPSQGQGQ